MKRRVPHTVTAILAAGAVAALGGVVTQGAAHETAPGAEAETGLTCAIVTRNLGDSVEISGKVSADRAVSGAYALTIRQQSGGGQAMIDQSGDFTVAAGRTVTLGEAVMGGTAQSYRAELELTVDGRRLRCRPADDITDI